MFLKPSESSTHNLGVHRGTFVNGKICTVEALGRTKSKGIPPYVTNASVCQWTFCLPLSFQRQMGARRIGEPTWCQTIWVILVSLMLLLCI